MLQKFFRIFSLKFSPLDHSVVIVSSVQPNSISAAIFKPGDRFLIINGVQINDAHVCKKVILESKGDFDVCFERPATGLLAYGIQVVFLSPSCSKTFIGFF